MRCNVQQSLILLLCLWGSAASAEPPAIWLDVPFVRQHRDGCGAASVAMVMQYWDQQQGKPVDSSADPERIWQALYSSKAGGIYASDLERYLQQHGFRTFAFRGQWSDLQQHLEKGRPLIVALKPNSGDASLHYVVVAGLDGEQHLILVNDPAQRKLLRQQSSDFEKEWKGAGNWTLLAVPKESGVRAL
jgi:predicted double-glycine peptidase